MTGSFLTHLRTELDGHKSAGLFKAERVIIPKQAGAIEEAGCACVLNL